MNKKLGDRRPKQKSKTIQKVRKDETGPKTGRRTYEKSYWNGNGKTNFTKVILEQKREDELKKSHTGTEDELQKKSYWNGNGKMNFKKLILEQKREDELQKNHTGTE
jgi:hypothetical protein